MIAPPKPPPHDELEALIKEARARQLRRRLLGAAAIAIAMAVALGVYALVDGGQVGNLAQAPAHGGRATGPRCRATQLSARAGLQGAGGSALGAATITNTSRSACSLPSVPPRVQILWHGRVLPARQLGGMAVSGESPVRVLAPHAKAAVYMSWREWCGRPAETTIIRPVFWLRFAHGLRIDARGGSMSPPRCDAPGSGTIASTIAVSRPLTDN